jgi:hypothetical protein
MHRNVTLKSLLPTSISSLSFLLYPLLPILSNLSHKFDDVFLPSESLLKERYLFIFHHSVCSPFILSVFIYDGLKFSESLSFYSTLLIPLYFYTSLLSSILSLFYTSISFVHFITPHSSILSLQIRLQKHIFADK